MTSKKKAWGVAILQMYYVAECEKIEGIDIASRLESLTKSFTRKAIEWVYQRKYLKDGKLTKRGRRFVKRETDDYEEIKRVMLRILNSESKSNNVVLIDDISR